MIRTTFTTAIGTLCGALLCSALCAQEPQPGFIENRGQWDAQVRYAMRRGPATAWFIEDGLLLAIEKRVPASEEVRDEVGLGCDPSTVRIGEVQVGLRFEHSRTERIAGEHRLAGQHHFCRGADPAHWVRGAAAYRGLRYAGVRPGVDVVLGDRGELAYDLHLQPGARLADFAIRCEGITGLRLDAEGTLVMQTELGPIVQSAPVTWELGPDGARRPLASAFQILDGQRYGFAVPGWNGATPLVVDPGISWASFLGGSGYEGIMAIGLDEAVRILVAGLTLSSNFPGASNGYSGGSDAMVSLIDPTLAPASQLLWSLYLGGSGDDIAFDVGYSAATQLITAVGITNSPTFPTTTNAFQSSHNGGWDGFVTQLDLNGNLAYSTYLGHAYTDRATAIEVDNASSIITVAGYSGSPGFPTTPGVFQQNLNGSYFDAFVTQLDPTLAGNAQLMRSTFLGGTSWEGRFDPQNPYRHHPRNWDLLDLHVAPGGEVTLAGTTSSLSFPTTANAYQPYFRGGPFDIFVSRLDAQLSTLQYSTFLGSSVDDASVRIAVDDSGVVTLCGGTNWNDFPTTTGAYDRTHGGGAQDGFLAQLDLNGNLLYSTFIGAAGSEAIGGLAVEDSGIITACGFVDRGAGPSGLRGTHGAHRTTYLPNSSGIALRLDPQGNGAADLHYLSFVGAGARQAGNEALFDLALTRDGRVVMAGGSDNPGYPSPGGFQSIYGGGPIDATVLIMDLLPARTIPFGASTPTCRAPMYMQVNSNPYPGNQCFEVHCNRAPANAPGVLFLGTHLANGLHVPSLGISLFAMPELPLDATTSDSAGFARSSCIPIPPYCPAIPPGLIALQWIWLDPVPAGCGRGFAASNALEIR